jgi:RimJ/RimL family protein N-acetyltransferase
MELLTYTDADLELTEAIECDADVMREVGGPHPRSAIPAIHRRRLHGIEAGDWWLKIVPQPPGPAAGTIGIWETTWNESTIHEAGWMLLGAYQGRGLATEALGLLLAKARAERRCDAIYAFPGVSNGPSNALCRKFGFELIGEGGFEYANRVLHCNQWRLELAVD